MAALATNTLRVAVTIAALIACIGLGSARSAAAAADVKIASLDCDSNPQVIELTNTGDESQDLTGWRLVSDPIGNQSYVLTPLGTLAAGSSVFIESGAAAESTFVWSTQAVFRAGDASDFARLVDNTGQTRSEEACGAQAQPTSTPAPTPTTAPPLPTSTTAPMDGVPDGGGPPSAASEALATPLTALIAGASLASLGGVMLMGLWLAGAVAPWKRREQAVFEIPPPPSPIVPEASTPRTGTASGPLMLALVAALCAAIIVALFLPTPGRRK